jgi:urea carboxylase
LSDAPPAEEGGIPEGATAVRSSMTASVWQVPATPGQRVEAGERVVILEAMKMEVAITSPVRGEVVEVRCAPGAIVHAGQVLAVIRSENRCR